MTIKTILAVDDEPSMLRLLEISLKQAGYQPILARDGNDALQKLAEQHVDCVVSDLHMPIMNGMELLKLVRASFDNLPFIMVTAQGEIKTAIEAMKLGAADYILRPFDLETLELSITKALSVKRLNLENAYLKAKNALPHNGLIGETAPMQALKKLIAQVGPEKVTVLITGETGTGKELVSKAIHAASPRSNALFVAVNCAAIPSEMLESELFGHEKGAFTGAAKERIGKFQLADGGTLFLDEITEMPIHLQAKLLRALQDGVIEKLGSNKQIHCDIRVIAATNINPLEAVKVGKLREDLYYRLNVFQLPVPALRERRMDISLLADYFLAKKRCKLSEEALQLLLNYAWPGNVRELENVVERASILAATGSILPQHLAIGVAAELFVDIVPEKDDASNFSIPVAVSALEKQLISRALTHTGGNKVKAAKALEISERSLWNKLTQYSIK